jgi:hypothetical protein
MSHIQTYPRPSVFAPVFPGTGKTLGGTISFRHTISLPHLTAVPWFSTFIRRCMRRQTSMSVNLVDLIAVRRRCRFSDSSSILRAGDSPDFLCIPPYITHPPSLRRLAIFTPPCARESHGQISPPSHTGPRPDRAISARIRVPVPYPIIQNHHTAWGWGAESLNTIRV